MAMALPPEIIWAAAAIISMLDLMVRRQAARTVMAAETVASVGTPERLRSNDRSMPSKTTLASRVYWVVC